MNSSNKIISNPSFLQIGVSVFSILFFSSLAYLMYDPKWDLKDNTDVIAMWIIIALFALFILGSFYMLFLSKKIELTNDYLLIEYPLLFHSKKFVLDDVKKVFEGDYNIKSSHNSRLFDVYNGKQITIEMFETKKIIITSFEVTNYKVLAKNLKNVTKSYFKLHID